MQRSAESLNLREAIRVSVQHVEESSGVAPDDPAIVELKQSVVRTVGELELVKAKREEKPEP
jgi:hypothetical protein